MIHLLFHGWRGEDPRGVWGGRVTYGGEEDLPAHGRIRAAQASGIRAAHGEDSRSVVCRLCATSERERRGASAAGLR